ncbi:MAG: class I SAM-dependent methyltransferase [Bacteroidota bacterium]
MREEIYYQMLKEDDTIWRSVATRKMLLTFWKKYRTPKNNYRVFELGPGGGATLRFFEKFGKVYGLDTSEIAVQYCRERGISNVILNGGSTLPLKDNSFDLCLAVDVIEHIKDDQQAMNELYRVCTHGGIVLTVIPAFQFLWSDRDVRLGHYKRYTGDEIRLLAENAGFRIQKLSYINLFYLPFLWFAVKIKKGRVKTDVATLPKSFNWLLVKMLGVETILLKRMDFAIGCSTIMVALKDGNRK